MQLLRYLAALPEFSARMATSPLRDLPDFVIAGTQKGGTTSLYNYLIQHPGVLPAMRKEIHYFDKFYFRRAWWYRSCFPTRAARRRHSEALGYRALTGEATPEYMFLPPMPARIHALLPDTKFIILLRNPITRAYSHYQVRVNTRHETLSFEDATAREAERIQPDLDRMEREPNTIAWNLRRFSYLKRGMYAEQIERWFRYFSHEQTLIFQSEAFYADKAGVFRQTLDFLGLPEWDLPEYKTFLKTPSYPPMDPATHDRLAEFFEPHNRRLYDLLGVEYDWS